jgi:hypothetical protein
MGHCWSVCRSRDLQALQVCVCGGGGAYEAARSGKGEGVEVVGVVEEPGNQDNKVTHVLVYVPSGRELAIRLPGNDDLQL